MIAVSACSSDTGSPTLADPATSTTSTTGTTPASPSSTHRAATGDDDPLASAIRVDQLGYRPADPKVAVIGDRVEGAAAGGGVEPGPVIEVRRVDDDEVVLSGPPEPWQDGQVAEASGDRGWWFDFTAVDEPGSYYLADPDTGLRSHPFEIDPDVYDEALRAALRVFWYNRGNIEHPADLAGPWSDGAAMLGPDQDGEARSIDTPDDPASARDLRGGWFDAGDTNKYVTFASEPVHALLSAWTRDPDLFGDDLGITESGNGIPDIIDEIRWETDWFERMQLDDGGVLIKVGNIEYLANVLPSTDPQPRFYEEVCSSSTIAAAGVFAHAAAVFGEFPDLADDADRLRDRAVQAWDWYDANPIGEDCDPQEVLSGDADWSADAQAQARVVAAVYLDALTGDERYRAAIAEGIDDTLPFAEDGFGHYGPDQAEALLAYRDLPTADPDVVARIDERLAEAASTPFTGFDPGADLYRVWVPDYSWHWGSNRVVANTGAVAALVDPSEAGTERALGHLGWFHGVNPLGLAYLSNLDELGGERSVEHLFHYWFGDDTAFDVGLHPEPGVPPGYVVGGPNASYSGATTPPAGEPPQRAYADLAGAHLDQPWELTEPAIYYQAAYVRLLTTVLAG